MGNHDSYCQVLSVCISEVEGRVRAFCHHLSRDRSITVTTQLAGSVCTLLTEEQHEFQTMCTLLNSAVYIHTTSQLIKAFCFVPVLWKC